MKNPEDKRRDPPATGKTSWGKSAPGEERLWHLSVPSKPYVVTQWHAQVGDYIHAPQVIATIECEIAWIEFEAINSGILAEQCVSIGEPIPDGAVVARILESDTSS